MKKTCVLMMALVVFFQSIVVSAQVVDMRAFSRQRGFKAYQPHASELYNTKAVKQKYQSASVGTQSAAMVGQNKGNESKDSVEKEKKSQDLQTREMLEYIENNPHVKPDI